MLEVEEFFLQNAAKVGAPTLIKKAVRILHEDVVDVCLHVGDLTLGNRSPGKFGAERLDRQWKRNSMSVDIADPAHRFLMVHGKDAVVVSHGISQSEEHTSELQSLRHLGCRLPL